MDPCGLLTQSIRLCLCRLLIVKPVYSGIFQSQGQICALLLELVHKEVAWHVLTGPSLAAPPLQNAVAGFIYTSREVRI